MKSFKFLTAGLLAFAGAGLAFASPTVIRFTGSTAFRSAANRSIINSLTPITGASTVLVGQSGATMDGANTAVFVGHANGTDLIIKAAWTGSVGGIQVIAQNISSALPYYDDPVSTDGGVTWKVDGVALSAPTGTDLHGTNLTGASVTPTESHTADIGLADCSPNVAGFVGGSNLPLNAAQVGIVPFVWAGAGYSTDGGTTTHAGLPPGFTNISRSDVVSLISGGELAAQITGNTADAYPVFYVGRDHDSGTRVSYLLTTQYARSIYDTTVTQYIANGDTVGSTQFAPQSVGTGLINSLNPWPAETVLGASFGSEGWFSGGNVKKELNRPCDLNAAGYVVSMLGAGDAAGINPDSGYSFTDSTGTTVTITQSQNALTYNGQYPGSSAHHFGPPYTNIEEGVYESWGLEYNYWQASHDAAGGDAVSKFGNLFRTTLEGSCDYLGIGIRLGDMHCTRVEGGQITHS